MFEQFPYADMQQLNLDWIIKIAKDFLDQYTHIQDVITDGETELENKATELENLLQQWYDTHSQDIANELVRAVAALSEAADQTIARIPADYTQMANSVSGLDSALHNMVADRFVRDIATWESGTINAQGVNVNVDNRIRYVGLHNIPEGETIYIIPDADYYVGVAKYASDDTFIEGEDWFSYIELPYGQDNVYKFRVVARKVDNSAITDVTEAASHITVVSAPNTPFYVYADQANTNVLIEMLNDGYLSNGVPQSQTYEIEKYSDKYRVSTGHYVVQYNVQQPSNKTPWIRFSYFDSDSHFLYEETKTDTKTIELTITNPDVYYIAISCRTFNVKYDVHLSGVFINYIAEKTNMVLLNKSASTVFVSREGKFPGTIENSVDGIKAARKNGYDIIRVDVQFTSDGVPVLFHDEYLGTSLPVYDSNGTRITNGNKISTYTYATLSTYHFGSTTNNIVTLDECAELCKKIGLALVLEMKDATNPTEQNISDTFDIVAKHGMAQNTEWDVYSAEIANYVLDIDETASIGYISEPITTATINTAASLKTGKNTVWFCAYASAFGSFTEALHIYGARKGIKFKMGSAYNIAEIYRYRKFEKIEVANVVMPAGELCMYNA